MTGERLAELLGIDQSTHVRTRRVGVATMVVVLSVVLAGGCSGSTDDLHPGAAPTSVQTVGQDRGPTGSTAAPGADSYAFIGLNPDSTPVRWDPCQPIRYQVRTTGGPDGATELVGEVFDEVSAITGLRFEFAGTTDEVLTDQDVTDYLNAFRPAESGVPVWVGWATFDETDAWQGDPTLRGFTRTQVDRTRVHTRYLSGVVAVRSELDAQHGVGADETDPNAVARGVLRHEIGHLVGLEHVDDQRQLMSPGRVVNDYAAGDLAGLRQVGAEAGCYERKPNPSTPPLPTPPPPLGPAS